ncbi:UDP-glucose dehydrogenase family protein [Mesobacillus zeae]|uniref:UDP-glucose 6-dehydrogenase n=1 Tax=Mesobacillus zeae TaxID=1917180 RepID=A0A398B9M6_9BACI|nr:UDP-glucose/GDP-mannose dehydrogenase family protein [Mesobacillus zeae]RID86809.1 UDP-glucose/GDP-mannose dehydrogenase family protein [Mesobacillus zeae]
MNITVAGTGYVGLVTGVCFAEAGYTVTCFDTDTEKINTLSAGISTIYEPGLEEMLVQNMDAKRLRFTVSPAEAYSGADFIFIAVGTPEREDGSANLDFVESVAREIAEHARGKTVVAVKSTVPVGTNRKLAGFFNPRSGISIVSNPEFLREGSGIADTFQAERIVIGTDDKAAGDKLAGIYRRFGVPILRTGLKSAEMIKYASNAFLAAKISLVNEIANFCEVTGADIEEVALGMGMDSRIGSQFLRAGIGYGGSCFPKDTKALVKLGEEWGCDFSILKSVIEVNSRQKQKLVNAAIGIAGSFKGKRAAVLGLSFKPFTDDIREAPALEVIRQLLDEGADISVYDPAAMGKMREIYGDQLYYAETPEEAVKGADFAFVLTEWPEITAFPLEKYRLFMRQPVLLDGRNCYSAEAAEKAGLTYVSIGRKAVLAEAVAAATK